MNINRAYLKQQEKEINRLREILFPKNKSHFLNKNIQQNIKFYQDEEEHDQDQVQYKTSTEGQVIKNKMYHTSILEVNANSVEYLSPHSQTVYFEESEQKKIIKQQIGKLKQQIDTMLRKCPTQSTNSWLYQSQNLQNYPNTEQSQNQNQVSQTQRHYLASINKLSQALEKYNQYIYGIEQAAQQLNDNLHIQHFQSKYQLQIKNKVKYYLTSMICNVLVHKIETCFKKRVRNAFELINGLFKSKKVKQKHANIIQKTLQQQYKKKSLQLIYKGFSRWRQVSSFLYYKEKQQIKRQTQMPWKNQPQNFILKNQLFIEKLVLYFQTKLNQNHFKCQILLRKQKQGNIAMNSFNDLQQDVLIGYIYSQGQQGPQIVNINDYQNVLQSISSRSAMSNFSCAKNIKQYEIPFRSSNSLTKLALEYKKIIKIERTQKNPQFSLIDRSILSQIQYKLINTQRQAKQQANFNNLNKLECLSQSACIFYPIIVDGKVIGIIRQYFESGSFSSISQITAQSLRYIGETLNSSMCLTKKLKQLKQEKHYIQKKYHLKAIKVIQSLQSSKFQNLFQNLSKNLKPIFNFQYAAQLRLQKRNQIKDSKAQSQIRQKFILSKQQQIFNIQEDVSLSECVKNKILFAVQKMKRKDISHFLTNIEQETNENDQNRTNTFTNVEAVQKKTNKVLLYIKIGLNLYSFVVSLLTDNKVNMQNNKILPLQIITDVLLKYEQIKQIKEKQSKRNEMIKIQEIKTKYESKLKLITQQIQKQMIQIYSNTGTDSKLNSNIQTQNLRLNIFSHITQLFKALNKGVTSLKSLRYQNSTENKLSNQVNAYQLPLQMVIKSLRNNKQTSFSDSKIQFGNVIISILIRPQDYKIMSIKTLFEMEYQIKKPLLLYSSLDSLQRVKSDQAHIFKQISVQMLCEKQKLKEFLIKKQTSQQYNQKESRNQYLQQFQKIQSEKLQDIFMQMFKQYFDCYFSNSFKNQSNILQGEQFSNRKRQQQFQLQQTQIGQSQQQISTFQCLKQKMIELSNQFVAFHDKKQSSQTQQNQNQIQFLIKDSKQLQFLKKQNQKVKEQVKHSKFIYLSELQKSKNTLSMKFCPSLSFNDQTIQKLIIKMELKHLFVQKQDQLSQSSNKSKNQSQKNLPTFIVKLNSTPILKIVLTKTILPSELNHTVNNDFLFSLGRIITKYEQNQQNMHKVKLLQQFNKIQTLYLRKQTQLFCIVLGKIKIKSKQIKNKIDNLFNLNKLLKKLNKRAQQHSISHWKKETSLILFNIKSEELIQNLQNPIGYKYENIKQLIQLITKLGCKKIKELFLIHKKSTKGKFRNLLDQKICQVYDNRVKLHLQHGFKSIKSQSDQRLRLNKFSIYESEQKTCILKEMIGKILNSVLLSSFNYIKKHQLDSFQKFFNNQAQGNNESNQSLQSISLEKLQLLLNKCKNMNQMQSFLQSVKDLSQIQIWMRIGKKNENYLNIKNKGYFQQKEQVQVVDPVIRGNNIWMTLQKDQLFNLQQKYILYESPNQVLFIFKKQTYQSFGFKQKDYLNQLSKTFRQYFTHFKHDLKCRISLNQEILKYMNKLTLKQSFQNWRNVAQQCLKVQKYKMNDRIYEVCAEMENIKQKIKFQEKQKEEITKQYKKLTLKQEQMNSRIQKYISHIEKIQASINQQKQGNLGLSQQKKIILQQSLFKWRQVNFVQKVNQKKLRDLTKSVSLLIRIVFRMYKSQQRKAMREGINRICGYVMHLKQQQKLQKLNQRSLANQLQEEYQQLNARLMTFQKNHFNTNNNSSVNLTQQNQNFQQESQSQKIIMDKDYWYQADIKLKPNLFQSQSIDDLKQYDQYENPYYNSKENQNLNNNSKNQSMQQYEEFQVQKTSQSYRKNGACLSIPLVINRLKMNEPNLNKENVDVTLEQQNRINKGIYKLNGKTLRFLKRMGKINQQK